MTNYKLNLPLYELRSQGPAGGFIFHIANGIAYECAPVSTEWDTKLWGGRGTLVGASGFIIGGGKENTDKIVNALSGDSAAKLCDDLSYGGYSDWFLPSRDELKEMYNILKVAGVGDFSGFYWSSTESSSTLAWEVNFNNGYWDTYDKINGFKARAVRSFKIFPGEKENVDIETLCVKKDTYRTKGVEEFLPSLSSVFISPSSPLSSFALKHPKQPDFGALTNFSNIEGYTSGESQNILRQFSLKKYRPRFPFPSINVTATSNYPAPLIGIINSGTFRLRRASDTEIQLWWHDVYDSPRMEYRPRIFLSLIQTYQFPEGAPIFLNFIMCGGGGGGGAGTTGYGGSGGGGGMVYGHYSFEDPEEESMYFCIGGGGTRGTWGSLPIQQWITDGEDGTPSILYNDNDTSEICAAEGGKKGLKAYYGTSGDSGAGGSSSSRGENLIYQVNGGAGRSRDSGYLPRTIYVNAHNKLPEDVVFQHTQDNNPIHPSILGGGNSFGYGGANYSPNGRYGGGGSGGRNTSPGNAPGHGGNGVCLFYY